MNVLAFDTCLGAVSVAVRRRNSAGEWGSREAYEPRATGHAERLFPMIAEVMKDAELAFPAIDRIAVTLGPGTFTGVRLGVGAARAFGLAAGKPVVGVTSLAAMAHRAGLILGSAHAGRQLAVAVDARRDMIYFQLFGDRADQPAKALLLTPEQAADALGQRPTLVVGSGAAAVVAVARGDAEARLPHLQPHAHSVAVLAPELAPLHVLKPIYLRQPDVKPQGEKLLARTAS